MPTPYLSSERLFFEPLSLKHLSTEYVNWLNDPEIYRYLDTGGNYTVEDLKTYLGSVEKSNDILFWAIHLKENKKHIGNIKIDSINDRNKLAVYGIMMGDKQEWGKGYAKEATLKIINYCFTELHLRKITLGVITDNVPAVELYKKLGFETEGVLRKHGYYDGRYCDSFLMAIFNPEYTY
jgi:ribosomal-protein-alanine N-acetyltransferase